MIALFRPCPFCHVSRLIPPAEAQTFGISFSTSAFAVFADGHSDRYCHTALACRSVRRAHKKVDGLVNIRIMMTI